MLHVDQEFDRVVRVVSHFTKAQVRHSLKVSMGCQERPFRYLLAVKREAESDLDYTIQALLSSAWRRSEVHDDPGSAAELCHTAAILRVFGPKGLTF
jgi:hypothetical protein